jgi:hypothetical protein
MLTLKQKMAVKLMFHMTEEEVSKEVGVAVHIIARWWTKPEFRQALAAEEQAIKATVSRITSDATLIAAKKLHNLLLSADGKDAKIALDTLKASGAFGQCKESAAAALQASIDATATDDENDD